MRYVPRPPYAPAIWASCLLALLVLAATALTAFELGPGETLVRRLREAESSPGPAANEALAGRLTGFAMIFLLVVASAGASAAAFLAWMWHARTNAGLSGLARPRFSRGWAIGSWFIPAVGQILPPMIIDEVWRGSGRPESGRGGWIALLSAWWASWLALLGLVLLRPVAPAGYGVTGIGAITAIMTAVAAGLCAAVIWTITLRQARTLTARAHSAPAPAARRARTPNDLPVSRLPTPP